MTTITVGERLTLSEAERRHEAVLEILDVSTFAGAAFLPECRRTDGTRCFTFADVSSRETAERRFTEHAAEAIGICWSCSHPDDGTNREGCYRCWVMWWSRERQVVPRDIPEPWPGSLAST